MIEVSYQIEEGIPFENATHFFFDYDGIIKCDPYIGYITGLKPGTTSVSVSLYFEHEGKEYQCDKECIITVIE